MGCGHGARETKRDETRRYVIKADKARRYSVLIIVALTFNIWKYKLYVSTRVVLTLGNIDCITTFNGVKVNWRNHCSWLETSGRSEPLVKQAKFPETLI